MTTAETAIVNKYLNEIDAAVREERAAIVSELYVFLGTVEKRINLTKLEAEAKSLLAKAEQVVSTAVSEVVGEVKAIAAAVESHL